MAAIITIVFNFFIWNRQHSIEYRERIIEKKISLIDDLASIMGEYERLTESKVEYYALLNQYSDGRNDISFEQASANEQKIKELNPELYNYNREADIAKSKLLSKFTVNKAYFGQETTKAIESFIKNVTDKGFPYFMDIYIAREKKLGNPNFKDYKPGDKINYKNGDLIKSVNEYMDMYIKDIVDAMYKEEQK